jgi:DNA mismatch repair protein PMS2
MGTLRASQSQARYSRSLAFQVRDHEVLATANVEIAEDNAKETGALSRLISKTDFNKIQAVGQFNLGSIVTWWRKCKEGEDKGLDD